jgi:hypothetical protein
MYIHTACTASPEMIQGGQCGDKAAETELKDSTTMKARPKTIATDTVPAAGKEYLGLGETASYAAADAGDIPTIGKGRNRRVGNRL